MDADQIKGKLQNAFGKVEEAVGEAIGSQNLANAGAEDRVKGAATETWGNTKDTVKGASETVSARTGSTEDRVEHRDESLRDRIARGAEHLRDSVDAKLDNAKTHETERRDKF